MQTNRQRQCRTSQEDAAIVARLVETNLVIEQIRAIAGNAGISLGVLHQGQVIYRASYGHRDVAGSVALDSDTIFPIASMTKALVAAQFASFADEGIAPATQVLR